MLSQINFIGAPIILGCVCRTHHAKDNDLSTWTAHARHAMARRTCRRHTSRKHHFHVFAIWALAAEFAQFITKGHHYVARQYRRFHVFVVSLHYISLNAAVLVQYIIGCESQFRCFSLSKLVAQSGIPQIIGLVKRGRGIRSKNYLWRRAKRGFDSTCCSRKCC